MMFHHHPSWLKPIYLAFQGAFGLAGASADACAGDEAPALLHEIRSILLRRWDPLLIQELPGASDQYDSYAREIYGMAKASASAAEIADFLGRVQTGTMGLFLTSAHNRAVAEKIAAASADRRQASGRTHPQGAALP